MVTISDSLVRMNQQAKIAKASKFLSEMAGTAYDSILAEMLKFKSDEADELFIPTTTDVARLNLSKIASAGGIADRAIALCVINTITIERMVMTEEEGGPEEACTMIALKVSDMFNEYPKALRKISVGRSINAKVTYRTTRYIGNNFPISKKEEPIHVTTNLAIEGDMYNAFMNLTAEAVNERHIFQNPITTQDVANIHVYLKSISNIQAMGVDQFEKYVGTDNVLKSWCKLIKP